MSELRTCTKCASIKNIEEFYKSGLRNDGTEMKRSDCIKCYLAMKRKKRLNNGKPKRNKVEDIFKNMSDDIKEKICVEMCEYECSISQIARKYNLDRGKLDRAKHLFYERYKKMENITPGKRKREHKIPLYGLK